LSQRGSKSVLIEVNFLDSLFSSPAAIAVSDRRPFPPVCANGCVKSVPGAFSNLLSLRAGRQVSKVSSEDRVRIRGLNGDVNKVYSSDKATLSFRHFRQSNLGIITLDLSTVSRHTGTEVSGLLGFAMFRQLDVKLDYRDGPVDFEFDPKRARP